MRVQAVLAVMATDVMQAAFVHSPEQLIEIGAGLVPAAHTFEPLLPACVDEDMKHVCFVPENALRSAANDYAATEIAGVPDHPVREGCLFIRIEQMHGRYG